MMIARIVGMVSFWILGILTAFLATIAAHGFLTGSSMDGYPPFVTAIAAATGIPMIFIWRYLLGTR